MNIATLGPPPLFELLPECFYFWIVDGREHADKPDVLRLLGARRKRPCNRRTSDERDEVPSPHGAFPIGREQQSSTSLRECVLCAPASLGARVPLWVNIGNSAMSAFLPLSSR